MILCVCVCQGRLLSGVQKVQFILLPTAAGHEVVSTALWRPEHAQQQRQRGEQSLVQRLHVFILAVEARGQLSAAWFCLCFAYVSLGNLLYFVKPMSGPLFGSVYI